MYFPILTALSNAHFSLFCYSNFHSSPHLIMILIWVVMCLPLSHQSHHNLSLEKKQKENRNILPFASLPGDSRRKRARKSPILWPWKPKKLSDWHLKRKELPPNAEVIKVCIFFMVIMFYCLFIFSLRLKCIFVSSGSYHTKMPYLPQSPKMTGCASVINFPLQRL